MPKSKTHNPILRIKKFKAKNNPILRATITNLRLSDMANILKAWLWVLDVAERFVFSKNLENSLLHFYIAYFKEQLAKNVNFDISTFDKEFLNIVDKWVKRNLQQNILLDFKDNIIFLGFWTTHILHEEKLLQKYGFFDYSLFDISHFF